MKKDQLVFDLIKPFVELAEPLTKKGVPVKFSATVPFNKKTYECEFSIKLIKNHE